MDAELEPAVSAPTKQMVVFRVGEEVFAVDIGVIREVIKLETLTPVPGSPDSVAGIINIRGRIVPVMELGVLLKIGKHANEIAYVLLIETADGSLVGMIVDEVLEIRRFESSEIKSAPEVLKSKVSQDFVGGVILPKDASDNQRVILMINIGATINQSVAEILRQITDDQQSAIKGEGD